MNGNILDILSTIEKIETKNISTTVRDLISIIEMKASHSRHIIISHILKNHKKYFTAKGVYENLYKATVYNTLNTIREKKVLKDLKTDQKEAILYLSFSSSIAHFT